MYHILFTPNPDAGSAYPYQLVWIQQMPAAPEMDGQLNFTWEELLDANMLSNVLSFSPAIRTSNPFYGPDSTTWIYRLNGHTAIVQSVNQYLSGSYGVWSFDSYDLPDGGVRACVGYYSDDPNEDLYDEYYLINYLSGITNIELLREEEELFWLDCTFYGESTEQIAIDKGTLVLREIDFVYDPAYEPSVTLFESSPAPELPLMEGWNGPLRSVTAHWEDYDRDYGCLRYRTETLELPLDWEYLPYDARWGDYTAYNTEAYVGTYVYPGDGIDYEVYFTVAKG